MEIHEDQICSKGQVMKDLIVFELCTECGRGESLSGLEPVVIYKAMCILQLKLWWHINQKTPACVGGKWKGRVSQAEQKEGREAEGGGSVKAYLAT